MFVFSTCMRAIQVVNCKKDLPDGFYKEKLTEFSWQDAHLRPYDSPCWWEIEVVDGGGQNAKNLCKQPFDKPRWQHILPIPLPPSFWYFDPTRGDKCHLYEREREREAFTNQIKEVEKGMGLFLLCGVDNNRQAEMTIRWRRKDSIISLILSPQTVPSKRKGLRSVNKVGGGWVWEGEKKARERMTRTITRRLTY